VRTLDIYHEHFTTLAGRGGKADYHPRGNDQANLFAQNFEDKVSAKARADKACTAAKIIKYRPVVIVVDRSAGRISRLHLNDECCI
jgi:hypothetical protein